MTNVTSRIKMKWAYDSSTSSIRISSDLFADDSAIFAAADDKATNNLTRRKT